MTPEVYFALAALRPFPKLCPAMPVRAVVLSVPGQTSASTSRQHAQLCVSLWRFHGRSPDHLRLSAPHPHSPDALQRPDPRAIQRRMEVTEGPLSGKLPGASQVTALLTGDPIAQGSLHI